MSRSPPAERLSCFRPAVKWLILQSSRSPAEPSVAASISEVFGNLNVAAASFLDFGADNAAGTLRFGIYTASALLTVQNFLPGNKLQFATGFNTALLPA